MNYQEFFKQTKGKRFYYRSTNKTITRTELWFQSKSIDEIKLAMSGDHREIGITDKEGFQDGMITGAYIRTLEHGG